jgi:hypothetical protein
LLQEPGVGQFRAKVIHRKIAAAPTAFTSIAIANTHAQDRPAGKGYVLLTHQNQELVDGWVEQITDDLKLRVLVNLER